MLNEEKNNTSLHHFVPIKSVKMVTFHLQGNIKELQRDHYCNEQFKH